MKTVGMAWYGVMDRRFWIHRVCCLSSLIFAIPALASTSMEQARRAVRHALGLAGSAISPLLPNGIYTIPEVGMVGEHKGLAARRVSFQQQKEADAPLVARVYALTHRIR
jgi:pyruvate/2-oxoglutarate dehydrogenase complex dihydrolipoamide dehydrogenase (E3) component